MITGLRGFVGSEYARRLVTNVVRQPSVQRQPQPQAAMPCAPFVAPRPPIAIKSAAMHWDLVRTAITDAVQRRGFVELVDVMPRAATFGEHYLNVKTPAGRQLPLGRVQLFADDGSRLPPWQVVSALEHRLDAIAEHSGIALRGERPESLEAFWTHAQQMLDLRGSGLRAYRDFASFARLTDQLGLRSRIAPGRFELANLDDDARDVPTKTLLLHVGDNVVDLGRVDAQRADGSWLSDDALVVIAERQLSDVVPGLMKRQIITDASLAKRAREELAPADHAELERLLLATRKPSITPPCYALVPGDAGADLVRSVRHGVMRAANSGDWKTFRADLRALARLGSELEFGRTANYAQFENVQASVMALVAWLDVGPDFARDVRLLQHAWAQALDHQKMKRASSMPVDVAA